MRQAEVGEAYEASTSALEAAKGQRLSLRRAIAEIEEALAARADAHDPGPWLDRLGGALEHMREQQAQFHAVERPAATGDLVVVDYTLAIDGHDPSSQTGYEFLVGAKNVLPEIDDAAVGLRAGEERQVPLRFADDHRREDLRGRGGQATVKVVEVKEKALPALDDDFAKSLGEFETLEALRAELLKQLEARREHDERRALQEKVVDAVVARHEFTVPDALVMRQVAHRIEHARESVRRQGIDPERMPWDYQKMIAELRPSAENAVRRALLLEAIADKEAIAPTETDVDAEVEKLAQASQRPMPAVRRMMEKSGDLEGLRQGLRDRMTLDLLVANAKVKA